MNHDKTAQQQITAWWQSPLGTQVLAAEKNWLQRHSSGFTGYFQLQIGGGKQILPTFTRPCYQAWLDEQGQLQANNQFLPFKSASVDQLVITHALEFAEAPHQLLREADRILSEDGSVILFVFNPLSLWGLRRLFSWRSKQPWRGHFFSRWRLTDWLTLLDFEVVERRAFIFQLPVNRRYKRFGSKFLARFGPRFWPYFGAVTVIVAKKRRFLITPLRSQWKRPNLFPGAGLAGKAVTRQGPYGSR
ncbi:MAG TPA: methyltransferase domain-containing protein [Methylophaga sp.]|nr:methyltransferase domain-containing protein [Methylophaga sp.]